MKRFCLKRRAASHSRFRALIHEKHHVLKRRAQPGMPDDEMNRGRFAFGHAHPLSPANENLQVMKRAAPDFPGRVAGMVRRKRARQAQMLLIVGRIVAKLLAAKQPDRAREGGSASNAAGESTGNSSSYAPFCISDATNARLRSNARRMFSCSEGETPFFCRMRTRHSSDSVCGGSAVSTARYSPPLVRIGEQKRAVRAFGGVAVDVHQRLRRLQDASARLL